MGLINHQHKQSFESTKSISIKNSHRIRRRKKQTKNETNKNVRFDFAISYRIIFKRERFFSLLI